jgi:tRNA-binding protein
MTVNPSIPFVEFTKIGLQMGRITGAEPFPAARNPSYKVTVDFGDRTLTTVAQLPRNYPDVGALVGKGVVGVTNLPERKIAGFKSQFLLVGFPGLDGHVQLLNTRDQQIAPGTYLYPGEKPVITYEQFQRAALISGTVLEVSATDICSVKLDMGPLLAERQTIMHEVPLAVRRQLVGTQVAVLCNAADDQPLHVLSVPLAGGGRLPLGVDGRSLVPNGEELF